MNEQNAGTEKTSSGSSARSDVASKSHEAAMQMKGAVTGRVDQVRKDAESAKEQTAERIRRVATQLRSMGNTLGPDDRIASAVADRAGQSIDRLASYVSSTDLRGVMRDTENLARRQPALFYGAAFLAGLALGRFMKSSAPEGSEFSYRQQREPMQPPRPEEPFRRDPQNPSQHYRENYDATFARDTAAGGVDVHATVNAEGTSVTGGVRPKDKAPESNGGSQRGRGRVS